MAIAMHGRLTMGLSATATISLALRKLGEMLNLSSLKNCLVRTI